MDYESLYFLAVAGLVVGAVLLPRARWVFLSLAVFFGLVVPAAVFGFVWYWFATHEGGFG